MATTANIGRFPAFSTASVADVACLFWGGACVLLSVVGWRLGADGHVALSAGALGLIPATMTFGLAGVPGWRGPWTAFAWTAFACVAAASTGGFASPMAAAFGLAPAFAARRAEVAEAALFALVGYAVAGFLAHTGPPEVEAGALPAIGAALSVLTAGALAAGRAPHRLRLVQPAAKPFVEPVPAAPPVVDEERFTAQRRRLAELAHELRTPLTHIIGFADVMRQRLFGQMNPKYGEYVELIHTSGQNLLSLSNRLLDLARLESGKFELQREEFDVAGIAEEVVRLSAESAGARGVALILEPVSLPLQVNADVSAVRQILVNLVTNAIKFTPAGGAVRVRALAHESVLRLEVEDTGPGIPPEERTKLGSAFERGSAGEGADGFGLGLSLVRAFAELHDGTLSFHEAPGGGALVRVDLPVFA
jgi:signal transduction histidine kinase